MRRRANNPVAPEVGGLLLWLQRAAILAMGAALIVMSDRIVHPNAVAQHARTLVEYLRIGAFPVRSTPPGPGAPPEQRAAPEAFGSRAAVPVSLSGVSPEVMQRVARRLELPLEITQTSSAPFRIVADRSVSEPEATVTVNGNTLLRVPPENEPELERGLRDLTDLKREGEGGEGRLPGLLPSYRPVSISSIVSGGQHRAPANRGASIPALAPENVRVRLAPALLTVRPGERLQLDFQMLSFDHAWYSLTDRPEVHFQVLGSRERLVPFGSSPGLFLVPIDYRFERPYERIVVEATLDGWQGRPMRATAAVLVLSEPVGEETR